LQVPNVLKVIYAPQKAVKELAANPTYLAPLLIVILFVAANVGFVYINLSKTYYEQTVPSGVNDDVWIENSTFWMSNAYISESSDAIIVNYSAGARPYYGTESMAFSINGSSEVSMELNNIGPVNCSVPNGYDELDFRVKQLSPQNGPENATLYLYSTNSSDYFYYNLTQNFVNSTVNEWNNLTSIALGTGWASNNPSADWSNITGFMLDLNWQAPVSNITVLVDGLFFHGPYESSLETVGGSYVVGTAFSYALEFLITWVILGGLLFLLSKLLGAKLVWKVLLIVIGCILITMVVQAVVNAAAWGSVSNVNVPFAVEGGVPGEGQAAYNAILNQLRAVSLTETFMQILTYIWTIALAGLAVHLLGELSWSRSFLAATVAYFVTLLIVGLLFG
jgi:hypothetical protein